MTPQMAVRTPVRPCAGRSSRNRTATCFRCGAGTEAAKPILCLKCVAELSIDERSVRDA
jgi:hypothetical protein